MATLLFSVFALAPGYLIGWLSDVLSFRKRLVTTRLLLAVVLSISVSPILWHWIGWLSGIRGIALTFAVISAAAALLFIRDLHVAGCRIRPAVPFVCLAGAWAVAAVVSLIDIQIQDRLYFSVVTHDYSVRTAIADAISRTGVLAANPFFFPGTPAQLRYHHFWLILCSLVQGLGGRSVDIRQALFAGTVWSGIALMALAPVCLRFLAGQGSNAILRRSLIGIGLLALTGLDLIPTVLLMKFGGTILADMDMWNEPISSFVSAALWVPHNIASLVACMTGFLLLWRPDDTPRARRPVAEIALAGAAFASAVGVGMYVALTFATFLGIWTFIAIARRWRRYSLELISSGLLAGILVAPHLLRLIAPGKAGAGVSMAFVRPWVRPLRFAEVLMELSHVAPWRRAAVNALLLPLNYFLELGFFFVIAILTYKRYKTAAKLTRLQLALSVLLITSLFIATFLQSTVLAGINDLGMRAMLVAQFVLVLWAVDFWPHWPSLPRARRRALGFMLALGAAGTVYEVAIIRIFPLLADRGVARMPDWISSDRQLGLRTAAIRSAYEVLQSKLPPDAIVQNNPDITQDDEFYGLYANRQTAAVSRGCFVAFGGSSEECAALVSRLAPPVPPRRGTAAGRDFGHPRAHLQRHGPDLVRSNQLDLAGPAPVREPLCARVPDRPRDPLIGAISQFRAADATRSSGRCSISGR